MNLDALKRKLKQEPGWASVREALDLDALIAVAEAAQKVSDSLDDGSGIVYDPDDQALREALSALKGK